MSSSKIIKASAAEAIPVRGISFDLSGSFDFLQASQEAALSFNPMFGNVGRGGFVADTRHLPVPEVELDPVVEEEIPVEPMACITEAELAQQLDEAYRQGLVEGGRQVEEHFDTLFQAMTEAATSVIGVRDKIIRETEEDLLRLAVSIAEKVIRRELETDREVIGRMVGEAMKSVSERDQLVISLNPADFDLVAANRNEFLPQLAERQGVTLKPDPSIGRSGCIVETELGSIDARIEAQLDEISKRLMDERTKVREPEARAPEER